MPDAPSPALARAQGITIPQGGDHYMPIGPKRPCITILVHGVNDLAGVYADIEKGLCDGLNERLDLLTPGKLSGDNPGRLMAATYSLPQDDQGKAANPDAIYYRRKFGSARRGEDGICSIVVPFYWGYREEEHAIQKDKPHGEWLDRHGNRLDKAGTKEGGPFANATTTLPDMWGNGFSGYLFGFVPVDAVAGTATHPLLPAAHRRYMVLGAQRLAMLVQIIRSRYPGDTINVVGHSQGTMLTLLANALLSEKGQRPVDGFVMMNSPYSLNEPLTETLQSFTQQQTREARLATLSGIVQFMTSQPNTTVSLADMAGNDVNTRVGGANWNGSTCQTRIDGQPVNLTERDNRGWVNLYFTPQDQTVGLSNVEGIGWQGIPDARGSQLVLSQLGARFSQRVFTLRRRNDAVEQVGAQPAGYRYILLRDGEKTWEDTGMDWTARFGRASFSAGQAVTLNSAALPLPVTADFANGADVTQRDTASGVYQANQHLDPVDARIAITRSSGWNPDKDLFTTEMDEGKAFARGRSAEDVEAVLNEGMDVADRTQVKRVIMLGNGKVNIIRSETPNEAARRWQRVEVPLSFHSAIPANPMHSQRVLAYDVAIGPTLSVMEEGFYAYLCRVADWRLDWQKTNAGWTNQKKTSTPVGAEDLPVQRCCRFTTTNN
ncbi:T6SS effector phospholipase Tle3 domain-containing protein [Dyella terrae]|uniref:T6SS effector phospholipase Tle3 domain-containing protein n=1 Tax=Dyella terrae TaxID=522259 RepID=UPI001EFD49BD|nr:DUF3274 domain-containing protein [Dyella terrae]ULU23588.1 hypothetical protein DYST_00486 [Dyella terrae]